MLGKLRAQRVHICANERTFAQTTAHFKSAYKQRAENCKTDTFHDYEHKFKRAEKSVLLKIQEHCTKSPKIPSVSKRAAISKTGKAGTPAIEEKIQAF